MSEPKIERVTTTSPCGICKGTGKIKLQTEDGFEQILDCEACNGKGIYNSYHWHITKDGCCWDGDTLK